MRRVEEIDFSSFTFYDLLNDDELLWGRNWATTIEDYLLPSSLLCWSYWSMLMIINSLNDVIFQTRNIAIFSIRSTRRRSLIDASIVCSCSIISCKLVQIYESIILWTHSFLHRVFQSSIRIRIYQSTTIFFDLRNLSSHNSNIWVFEMRKIVQIKHEIFNNLIWKVLIEFIASLRLTEPQVMIAHTELASKRAIH